MTRTVNVWNVGRISYKHGLQLQRLLTEQLKVSVENKATNSLKHTLLILEHQPVYTVGIRTKGYDEKEEARLRSLGAKFYRTNRGGLITFHGPGQLVVYPILYLKHLENSGIRWYVNTLEETVIHLCQQLGIVAERSPDTGVWVGNNKICAIGIHASRYVTSHGLALNCNTDLEWFKHIVPCGIEGKGVTSLTQQLGTEMTINRTIPHFLCSFTKNFQCELRQIPETDVSKLLKCLQFSNEREKLNYI